MKIRLRPSQSMRWMMNDINIFSSTHIHSRPQSPSFPGRLQIKPSGTGDENGSPLNHKRAFSKTLHHGDCFQKMRFWCPKNLRNIYRYAWTRPVEIKDLISARRNALKNGKKTAQILKGSGGGGRQRGGYTLFWRRSRENRDLANWLVATLLAAPPKQYSTTPTLIKLQNYLSYVDFTSMVY